VSAPKLQADFGLLWTVAERSLLANVVEVEGRLGLSAGAHQFRSLWTRDFCHAVAGLLRIGRGDVVRDHLELLLAHRREDGLLPRCLDTMDPKLRVAWASLARLIPGASPRLGMRGRLKPEFIDQHGEIAIDGNALAILAALRLVGATGDEGWWEANAAAFARLEAFHRPYAAAGPDGLMRQPPFSDWQDSVRREGATFYANLLRWAALRGLAARGLAEEAAADRLASALEAFRHRRTDGLYASMLEGPWVSLEGNLLAVDLGLVEGEDARALHRAVRGSPFWTRAGTPGFDTYPDYPRAWRNPGVRLVGLGHYHDRIRWSWLTALAAKVAARVGDRESARAALEQLEGVARRDGVIGEVYRARPPHRLWRSALYVSEAPFSWGAGMVLDAVAEWREAGLEPSAARPQRAW
jgi:glycogen debranching enzyme